MLENLPLYLNIGFILTTLLAVGMVILLIQTSSKPIAARTARGVIAVITLWLSIQALLSLQGIYTNSPESMPPRIILFGVLPALTAIIVVFNTKKGKLFIDRLSMQMLSYIHLFIRGAVPQLMTFDGRNLDILAGITAPAVGYFGIRESKMGKASLLVWNFICLALLLNIVVNAVLSAPSPFQQFAFDQPNLAILNFPYSWLPAFIVPLVLFAHLAAIRKLIIYWSKLHGIS